MTPAGLETATSASERPQNHASDLAATGTELVKSKFNNVATFWPTDPELQQSAEKEKRSKQTAKQKGMMQNILWTDQQMHLDLWEYCPSTDEPQTALFKDPVRTAL
jgi:hypothetical protein